MDINNIKDLKQLYVGNAMFVYYDICVYDYDDKKCAFLSLIDRDKYINDTQKQLKRSNNIYLRSISKYFSYDYSNMDFIKKKQPKSDFTHMIAFTKDTIDNITLNNEKDERIVSYVYVKDNENLNDKLYDKIYKNTSIPVLPEWMEYIKSNLLNNNYLKKLEIETIYNDYPFKAFKLNITKNTLKDIVQDGLRNKEISINGCTENSNLMELTDGLDSYLNLFADTLAERIQNSFHPKFIPGKDEYSEYVNNYDDSCFYNGIELYDAQKAGIQSCVNQLNVGKTALVIAEMGSGSYNVSQMFHVKHFAVLG